MSRVRVSRREFVLLSAVSATTAVVSACGGAAPSAPAEPEATSAPVGATAPAEAAPGKYQEAPSLAALVAEGKLPPVEERLPSEPLVVECLEEIGQYSDDLHRVLTGPADMSGYYHMVVEAFSRFDYSSGELKVIPNVVKGWDIEEDGAVYTFYMRKGMKWSDGAPFTADDIMFWYEDVALNEEISPVFPGWLSVAGEPVVIEKVDDYTVKFRFARPYGILLEVMGFRGEGILVPKHYLSQFHPKYADADELAAKVKEAGFENWYELFANRNDAGSNPDRPVLYAWKVETPFPGQRMVSVRNPYYWKVDTEGKQLPYFERLVSDLAENNEVIMMKAIAGEVDMQYRHMGFANFSLLKENEENGDYRVREWVGGPFPCIYVNQSAMDPAQREVLANKDFRHALSYAINRDECNDLFWHSLAIPGHPCAGRGDPFWKEGFGETAIEYDPDKANELLDSIGLDQRDADGYRLRPDGQRLRLLMEAYPSEMGVPAIDIFSQVAMYWQAVGIDAQAKEIERSLWSQRVMANEMDMPAYDIDKILWMLDPGWYVPYGFCYWAGAFAQWQATGGQAGEEPPTEIKEIIEWYDLLREEADPEKRLEWGQKILERHNEMIYVIGVCNIDLQPCVVKNDMVNVLENGLAVPAIRQEGLTWPFQMWRRA
ncbi:MAG: ABC transporter substrate-binding protein [Anaerolineae bacterium]|jgi:peptide/nickel transport system substrate-binding protein